MPSAVGGRQVDIVDAEAEAADRLAARELAQQLARQLGVGDEHRVGVARDREDVVGRRALRHAQFRIDARQRRLGRIERGKRAVGDGDDGTGHRHSTCSLFGSGLRTTRPSRSSLTPMGEAMHCARRAFSINRQHLRVHAVRRRLAVEQRQDVVDHDVGHLLAHLDGRAAEVRREHDVRHLASAPASTLGSCSNTSRPAPAILPAP